ncbi:putative glutaredoxin-like protein, partial [Tanacetum coccineum]
MSILKLSDMRQLLFPATKRFLLLEMQLPAAVHETLSSFLDRYAIKCPTQFTGLWLTSDDHSSCSPEKPLHVAKGMAPSKAKVNFKTFDILSDEEVRQGLKVYSNWSSYPQLYIKSELIGGSDIVLEMQKSGELQKILIEKGIISLEERLKKLVNSAPVMLFMKGTPDAPECGFSSKVVNALKEEGIKFGSFDIYSDEEVRQ